MHLRDVLHENDIVLGLEAENRHEAVSKIIQTLRGDPRIPDSEAFIQAFLKVMRDRGDFPVLDGGLWIPHLRTDMVDRMVMAFGGLKNGIEEGVIRSIILVAIPHAMASEYLRIIGGVCRVFRANQKKIQQATSPAAVLEELSKL